MNKNSQRQYVTFLNNRVNRLKKNWVSFVQSLLIQNDFKSISFAKILFKKEFKEAYFRKTPFELIKSDFQQPQKIKRPK